MDNEINVKEFLPEFFIVACGEDADETTEFIVHSVTHGDTGLGIHVIQPAERGYLNGTKKKYRVWDAIDIKVRKVFSNFPASALWAVKLAIDKNRRESDTLRHCIAQARGWSKRHLPYPLK